MIMIIYKGKEYPTKTFDVIIDGNVQTITIATDALSKAFGANPDNWDEEATAIDEQLYFYVERKYFRKSDEQIARYALDDSFELAMETEDFKPQNN